jgi:hypothetical protein
MPVDNAQTQLQQAAMRGGLVAAFGDVLFSEEDIGVVSSLVEGDTVEIRFGNAAGAIGTIQLDAYDDGNTDSDGLTLGLRGWQLDPGVASL